MANPEARLTEGRHTRGPWKIGAAGVAALQAENEKLRRAVETAYGILWRDVPRGSADMSIAARKALFEVITKDGQRRGIEHAIALYGSPTESEIIEAAP